MTYLCNQLEVHPLVGYQCCQIFDRRHMGTQNNYQTTWRFYQRWRRERTDGSTKGSSTKVAQQESMLRQIANYCPIIAKNTIVKKIYMNKVNKQCVGGHPASLLFSIKWHGHFLDFDAIKLEHVERPEDLFQRLSSFVDDNLLQGGGSLSHYGTTPADDEEATPTVENFIVLTWLRLIHQNLPALVKQKYSVELRSLTLASLKPEIALAIGR